MVQRGRKFSNAYGFDVTPNFEEQWLRFGHTVGINKFAVIEPQTSPEVVHEDWKTGHDSKYTPRATKFIAATRRAMRRQKERGKGSLNVRVMSIELFVPPFTLVGDFYDALLFGRL